MKSLKLQLSGLVILAAVLTIPTQTIAQWSVGATYEIRQEDPKNGFGIRVEREILKPIPIIDIGLRAHFSYFNDENTFSFSEGTTIGSEITSYDYGLAAVGGVSLGLIKPYIGIGIGSNTIDVDLQEEVEGYEDESESAFFWNSFVGAELAILPKLHPFIEYRFQPTEDPKFNYGESFDSNGRLILGLSLSF